MHFPISTRLSLGAANAFHCTVSTFTVFCRQLPANVPAKHSLKTESVSVEQGSQQQLGLNVSELLHDGVVAGKGDTETEAETEPSSSLLEPPLPTTPRSSSNATNRVNLRIHLTRSQSPSTVESSSDDWILEQLPLEEERTSVSPAVAQDAKDEGRRSDLLKIHGSSEQVDSIPRNLDDHSIVYRSHQLPQYPVSIRSGWTG